MTESHIGQGEGEEQKKFEGPMPEVSAKGLEDVLGQLTSIAVNIEKRARYANRAGESTYKSIMNDLNGPKSQLLARVGILDRAIPHPNGESWATEVRQRAVDIIDEEEASAAAESQASESKITI